MQIGNSRSWCRQVKEDGTLGMRSAYATQLVPKERHLLFLAHSVTCINSSDIKAESLTRSEGRFVPMLPCSNIACGLSDFQTRWDERHCVLASTGCPVSQNSSGGQCPPQTVNSFEKTVGLCLHLMMRWDRFIHILRERQPSLHN